MGGAKGSERERGRTESEIGERETGKSRRRGENEGGKGKWRRKMGRGTSGETERFCSLGSSQSAWPLL